jgi:uncharacterized protein YlxP (DUF503 family)
MPIGVLTLHIHLPGCRSLKEKRGRLKPLINRLHKEFNISVAEMDHLDNWGDSIIACALISNDNGHTQRSLQNVTRWIEKNWPDVLLVSDDIEII